MSSNNQSIMGILSRLEAAGVTDEQLFAPRTLDAVGYDIMRLQARSNAKNVDPEPSSDRLHLGCGSRRLAGWLNVDLMGSQCDVDIAAGKLPWNDDVFTTVVSQQVIEHLVMIEELLPLLRELRRVTAPGGILWLSTPCLAKTCGGYVEDRGRALLADRLKRWLNYPDLFPTIPLDEIPPQDVINNLFHQWGRHKNLFDFELLTWLLERAGLPDVEQVMEADLLAANPGFPPRHDDLHSVIVKVTVR